METVRDVKDRVSGRTDQDYYVNLLAHHPGHLARSKAKAERYRQVVRYARDHPVLWKLGFRPARPKRPA